MNEVNDFLYLNIGSNVVRFLSKPYQYLSHADLKIKGSPNYGQKMMCNAISGQCKFCDDSYKSLNEKKSQRWLVYLIDRKSNSVKLYDFGVNVFLEIRKYAVSQQWGDPINYDIDLYIDDRGEDLKISPIVRPPSLLNESDNLLREHIDLNVLKHLTNHENCSNKINTVPFEKINWKENWI